MPGTGTIDLPLAGLRVIELAAFAFVPSAGAILSDWGAEVIKVEHPTLVDPFRMTSAFSIPAEVDGVSPFFEAVNRNKKGVAIDLNHRDGLEAFLRMVDTADVLLTSFLPDARARLGIDEESICERNPRIVYAVGSGYGPEGNLAQQPGFDGLVYWGRTGAALGATPPGEIPPLLPSPAFGDLQSGVALAGGVAAALARRGRTGVGGVVDASLFSSGIWAMGIALAGCSVTGVTQLPYQGQAAPTNPLANQYRTADGRIVFLGFMQPDRYWDEFCIAVDRVEWITDSRFADMSQRNANAGALVELLDELFAERPLDEWVAILRTQPGPWDVVQKVGDVLEDEQALANGFVRRSEAPPHIAMASAPASFRGDPPPTRPAPRLGEHTHDVLLELGLSAADQNSLRAQGVIG
jgi:crotonobetainyl-CoA:carnitine CoA-transferase CaiB-like acyl-CoA transferase